MMNSTAAPSKRSQIEKSIDSIIFAMFGVQAVLCGTGAICNALWTRYYGPDMWYLMPLQGNYEFDPDKVGGCKGAALACEPSRCRKHQGLDSIARGPFSLCNWDIVKGRCVWG